MAYYTEVSEVGDSLLTYQIITGAILTTQWYKVNVVYCL